MRPAGRFFGGSSGGWMREAIERRHFFRQRCERIEWACAAVFTMYYNFAVRCTYCTRPVRQAAH